MTIGKINHSSNIFERFHSKFEYFRIFLNVFERFQIPILTPLRVWCENLRQSFNPNSFSLPRAVKLNILSSDFRSTARLAVAAERSSTVVRRASDVGCVTQQLGERTAQSNTQGGKSKKQKIQIFFYLFPHKHLQIQPLPKIHEFSIKCASRSNSGGPERSRGIRPTKGSVFRRKVSPSGFQTPLK